MNFPGRLSNSLRANGPAATIIKLRSLALDHWFDFRYGVDTCSWSDLSELQIASENKEKGYRYQPLRVLPLRRLFREIAPMAGPDSVLVDIGSGKGRVLMVASEFGFREARGIEFSSELCAIARKNLARFEATARPKTRFRIIEQDAALYPIQNDENVFVMYNPFDGAILLKVLENIRASLRQRSRKVLILYHNPRWSEVFEAFPEFRAGREIEFWGYKSTVFSNEP